MIDAIVETDDLTNVTQESSGTPQWRCRPTSGHTEQKYPTLPSTAVLTAAASVRLSIYQSVIPLFSEMNVTSRYLDDAEETSTSLEAWPRTPGRENDDTLGHRTRPAFSHDDEA